MSEKWWGMFFLLAFPIFVTLSPVLVLGKFFFHEDAFSTFYPFLQFYKNSLNNGDSFLWNPYIFSGFPTFASLSGGFFDPFNYVAFGFFSVLTAYHWLIFLHIAFGAFFLSRLLKKFNVSAASQYIGGIIYVMSMWRLVPDFPIAGAVMFFPLFFLFLWKMIFERRILMVFVLGALIGYGFLSIHYHYFLEILFSGGFFVLFCSWLKNGRSVKGFLAPLFQYGSSLFLGAILGMVQLLPVFVYMPLSVRAGGFSAGETISGGMQFADALHLFLPYFNPGPYIPIYFSGEQVYIGMVPLFLAILGFSFRPSSVRAFFSLLLIFSIGASFSYSPIFLLISRMPLFNLLHFSGRWMFISALAVSVLSAFGFEFLFAGKKREILIKISRIFFWFGVGIFSLYSFIGLVLFIFKNKILVFLKNYFTEVMYARTSGLPLRHYYDYLEKIFNDVSASFNIFDVRFFIPVILFLVSIFLVKKLLQGSISEKRFRLLAVAVIIVNFISVFGFFHLYASRKVYERIPESVSFLSGLSGRVVSFLPTQTEFLKLSVPGKSIPPPDLSMELYLAMISNNLGILYGLENVDYFDPLMSRRMARVVAYLGGKNPTVGESLVYAKGTPEEKVKIFEFRKNVLSFTGARYIVSSYPFDERAFPKIFETSIIPAYTIPIVIYENNGARPRFYFADSLEMIPEDEVLAFEKLKTIPEKGLGVFVECPSSSKAKPCSFQGLALEANGQGELEIKTKKNTVSILKTKSKTPQFLVFSENHLPGWKAYVDGRETTIYTVGSVYMGIDIPSGEHEIRFEFTYKSIMEEFVRLIGEKFKAN